MGWRLRAATRSLMSASRAFDEFPHRLDRLAGGGAHVEVENCADAGKHKGVAPIKLETQVLIIATGAERLDTSPWEGI